MVEFVNNSTPTPEQDPEHPTRTPTDDASLTEPLGKPKSRKTVRKIVVLLVVAILLVVGRPLWHVARNMWNDKDEREVLLPTEVDDASRLNKTTVSEVWPIPSDIKLAEKQLAELLLRASDEKKRISIAGARHSMGGHTIYPDGIVVDMLPFDAMRLNEDNKLLTVGSGAKWAQIIEFLDERGFSVAIMQSNNSFSVGGSISVNCHGWQHDRPPIASSVDAFRLMKADGEIVRCSRDKNSELFSLVLGGYGLFGIILDVDLRVVPNRCYRLTQLIIPVDAALDAYQKAMEQDGIEMVYARMNIANDNLLNEVILNVLTVTDQKIPALKEKGLVKLRRAIFRGSIESDYGKELRWKAETQLQPQLSGKLFSRNQMLNEGVEIFQNRTAESTDILHEYFVPMSHVAEFVADVRQLVQDHDVDLLNVTVRQVKRDTDTFLRYADQEMFAFVMLYNQKRNRAAETVMRNFTRSMIDAALKSHGRYYLPYRLHATNEQFHRAYPLADEFFKKKLEYDPGEVFQNRFYQKYASKDVKTKND
jgi:FAD/FMN-containing dehydrogenase